MPVLLSPILPSRRWLSAAVLSIAGGLAGCGGEMAQDAAAPARTLVAVPVSQADHERIAHQLYMAYLGRAADPAGLSFFADVSKRASLPADMGAMYWRYGVETDVRNVLDSLAGSPEAFALYSSDHQAAVTAMYRNLFNRDPDSGGLAFWSGVLASGALTRGQVPVALLAGAHVSDLRIFERKAEVAAAFTAALDTPGRVASYHGDADVAALRRILSKVTAATTAAEERVLVEEALAAVGAAG